MGDFKELVVVIGLTLPVFWIARAHVCEIATERVDFDRRRNLWIAITVLAFMAHSFWIYIAGTALLLAYGSQRESNRMALFLALLMAVPQFSRSIPGFAGIQQIMSLTHGRLLAIVLLLPAYLMIRRVPGVLPFGRTMPDKCLLAYLLLQLGLQISVDSLTNTFRYAIYSLVDVFLPYYVASRGIRDLREYRDTLMALVMAVILMAPIAIFEYFRNWLLYSNLAGSMGIESKMGSYMIRGGNLRATASAEHSIVLGYIVTSALGFFLFVRQSLRSRLIAALALGSLVATLIASSARGPWVGALAVLLVVLSTGPDKFNRAARVLAISIPALVLLSFTETGRRLFEVLPFVGNTDTDSVEYRQVLFDTSMVVIRQHPWFGAFDYLVNPDMQGLIQGEGIIDVVNSFLGVALTYGLVGLSLFCGVFGFAALGVWRVVRSTPVDSDLNLLGRTLLSALAGVLTTIVTVSSIGLVPLVYWTLAGLCVGYAQMGREPQLVKLETFANGLNAQS